MKSCAYIMNEANTSSCMCTSKLEGGEGQRERERESERESERGRICERANMCLCVYAFTNSICMDEGMR